MVLFGEAKEFAWSDKNSFATLTEMNEVVIHGSAGEVLKSLNFDFYVEKIFGGKLLGVAGSDFVLFYDWNGEEAKGKIDAEVKEVYWSGEKILLCTEK